jgi:Fe-S-cluster containining protein
MRCTKCCEDMDVPIRHLLMPEVFLDADGLAFIRAHGLDEARKRNEMIAFKWGDLVFKMPILSLAFPAAYLDAKGLAFWRDHDMDRLIQSNVKVKLLHRCERLTEEGLCSIYDTRPRACREYDCSTREDCTNTLEDEKPTPPLALVN